MHILLNTLPPTSIIGVYQEKGITNEEYDEAHKVLKNKVKNKQIQERSASLWEDMNAAINPSAKPFTKSAKNYWTGKEHANKNPQ